MIANDSSRDSIHLLRLRIAVHFLRPHRERKAFLNAMVFPLALRTSMWIVSNSLMIGLDTGREIRFLLLRQWQSERRSGPLIWWPGLAAMNSQFYYLPLTGELLTWFSAVSALRLTVPCRNADGQQ